MNCENCPNIGKCCKAQGYRIIRRHIKEELNENARERRLSERGKELYKLRKEKIERSFADSKQNHGYRYAMYKGIEKNQNYTWLICATQNMKNIVTKLTNKLKNFNGTNNNSFEKNYFLNFNIIFSYLIKFFFKIAKSMKKSWTLSTV